MAAKTARRRNAAFGEDSTKNTVGDLLKQKKKSGKEI